MLEAINPLEAPPAYYIPIVGTFPGMCPDILETFAPVGTQALVIESNAHAALATNLHPTIEKITRQGTAIFVLADNYGAPHGVTHIADEPQAGTLNAGAFYLETLGVGALNADDGNQGNLLVVVEAIKEGIDRGLAGKGLGEFVGSRFRYPEGEKPSPPRPVVALRAQHEKLKALGLGGFTVTQLQHLEEAERAEN